MNQARGLCALVFGLATLSAIGWFLLAGSSARGIDEPGPRERAPASVQSGQLVEGNESDAPVIADAERSAIPSESPPPMDREYAEPAAETPLDTSVLTVRGTVVGAQQQTLDCRIEVRVFERHDSEGNTLTFEGVPDARGRFTVRLEDPEPDSEQGRPQLRIEIHGEGLCTRGTSRPWPANSDVLDVGTMPLHWGARIFGTITNQDGESLPKVKFTLRARDTQDPGMLWAQNVDIAGAHSDERGDIVPRDPIRATTWSVTCHSPGVTAVEPSEITLRPGEDAQIAFVCTMSPPIEGRVSTDEGPVGGVDIGAFNLTDGASAGLSVISRKDGRFVLRRSASAQDEVLVKLNNTTKFTSEPVVATWGDTGVELRIQPRKATRLQLTRAGDAPFPGEVWLSQSDPEWPNLYFRQVDCSPAGVVDIVLTEETLVHVALDTTCYSPWAVLVSPAMDIVDVPLRTESSTQALRVTDASGAPIAGATVEVLLSPFEWAPANSFRASNCFKPSIIFPGQSFAREWSQASTDATGLARQAIPAIDRWTAYWGVEAPGYLRQVLTVSSERAALERASRVQCELSGDWPDWLQVKATRGADTVQGTDRLDGSGSFDFEGLGSGRWTFNVSAHGKERAVATLDVTSGEDASLVVHAREHVLRGGLFRPDGLASSDAAVSLVEPTSGRETKLDVSTLGVRVPNLLRGDYGVRVESGGETRTAFLETTLEEVIGLRLDD